MAAGLDMVGSAHHACRLLLSSLFAPPAFFLRVKTAHKTDKAWKGTLSSICVCFVSNNRVLMKKISSNEAISDIFVCSECYEVENPR